MDSEELQNILNKLPTFKHYKLQSTLTQLQEDTKQQLVPIVQRKHDSLKEVKNWADSQLTMLSSQKDMKLSTWLTNDSN